MPRGRPVADRPDGTVTVGNPQDVQGPWNIALPVTDRSLGAGVGVVGVSRTSARDAKDLVSAMNCSLFSSARE